MAIVTPLVQPDYTTSPARFVETSTGKQILLRGVDLSMDAGTSIVDLVDTLGCNFVRIACFWNEIEPTAPTGTGTNWTSGYTHSYDSTALGNIDTIVSHLAGLTVQGLPVMCQIDLHQAGWSPFFGGFSGVPSWYYTNSKFPGSSWTTSQQSQAIAAWWTTESAASQAFYTAYASMMVARYSQHANVVMYNSFNEPNAGGLSGTSAAKCATMHSWLAPVVQAMSAADTPTGGQPTRGISVMCRGGGEGGGTATFAAFGTKAQKQALNLVMEMHAYYTGLKPGYPAAAAGDVGLDSAGDNWTPNSAATHINSTPGYHGTQAYQQNLHGFWQSKANTLGIPLFIGEWGCNWDDSGFTAYHNQVQAMMDANKLSSTRWLLATISGPGSLNLVNSGSLTGTGTLLQTWFQNTTFVIGGTSSAPVNTTAPATSGTPVQSTAISCDTGQWTANPAISGYTYQWQTATASGGPFSNIGGATSSSFTIPTSGAGAVGKYLRCVVTATNSIGSTPANSDVQGPITASGSGVPTNTVVPVVTDTTDSNPPPNVGDILSTTNGTWTGSPTSYAYQWQRLPAGGSVANISGETSTTYTTSATDVGAKIRVQIIATNGTGASAPAFSVYTQAVVNTQSSATIWFVSDQGAAGNHATAKSVASNIPSGGAGLDLVVYGGDDYAIGMNADFTADIPDTFGPSGRNVYPIFVPMIGNHDWDNATAGYDAFYTGKGTRAFISPHYGRIDIAGWTLLFINGYQAKTQVPGTTTPAPDSSAGVGTTQLSWIQNNIPGGSNNPSTPPGNCIIFCHPGRYSPSLNHRDNANLANVWNLLPGKVTAWVHGHAHNMSFQDQRDTSGAVTVNAADGTPNGTFDVCCGAGGEGNYDQNTSYTPAPLYFRGSSTAPQYGYLLIKIVGNSVTFEFHDQSSALGGTTLFSKTILASTGGGGGNPPVNTTKPSISDTTPQVAEVLGWDPGIWTGDLPITYTPTWQNSADGGATYTTALGSVDSNNNYTVDPTDLGDVLRVRVKASNASGNSTAFALHSSAVISSGGGVPVLVTPPSVTPTNPSVNTLVSTDNGTWTNAPTGYAYQWQSRDPSGNITNLTTTDPTGTTYTAVASDVGNQITCQVTASNGSGSSVPTNSNFTAGVTTGNPGALTVNITGPGNGDTVNTTLVTVTVDAEDTDGIQSVKVRAVKTDGSWTGEWVDATGTYPIYSADVVLSGGDGQYEIDADAVAMPTV